MLRQVKHVVMLLGLCPALWTTAAMAEEADELPSYDGWYQIDVILFTPRSTDLDEESWPESELSLPADMISVDEPYPFRLSLLEQAYEEIDFEPVAEETPVLQRNEFLFQQESRSNYNRRVLASVTAPADTEADDEQLSDPEGDDVSLDPTDEETAANENEQSASPAEPINYGPTPGSYGDVAFSLSQEESSLRGILGSLRRSSRYDVLTHKSWLQPVENEPTPVLIQTGDRYDDNFEVEGILSFFRSRFLHVQTDLQYTVFESRGGTSSYTEGFESNLSTELLREYSDLVEVERQRGQFFPARTHAMKQSRRMRSGEVHYLDHPLFGVIVRINRYQPDV